MRIASFSANLRELDRAEPQTIEDILEIVYERDEALHSLTLAIFVIARSP